MAAETLQGRRDSRFYDKFLTAATQNSAKHKNIVLLVVQEESELTSTKSEVHRVSFSR